MRCSFRAVRPVLGNRAVPAQEKRQRDQWNRHGTPAQLFVLGFLSAQEVRRLPLALRRLALTVIGFIGNGAKSFKG
jgi:hypothetical protein